MNLHPLAWAQQEKNTHFYSQGPLSVSQNQQLFTLPETILSIINILNLEKYQMM